MSAPGQVRVQNLAVSYGKRQVLRGVSLDIHPGEIHALLGANGAGKSTLIKCLGGGVRWEAGTITLDEVPHAALTPRQSQALGVSIIYQDLKLIGPRTIAENLVLGREPRSGPLLLDQRTTPDRSGRTCRTRTRRRYRPAGASPSSGLAAARGDRPSHRDRAPAAGAR